MALRALAGGFDQLRSELVPTLIAPFFSERSAPPEEELHRVVAVVSGVDSQLWEQRIAAVLPDFKLWSDWVEISKEPCDLERNGLSAFGRLLHTLPTTGRH